MKIRKKGSIGIIGDSEDEPKISLCERCLKLGFYSVLGERIYLPNELIDGKIPRDSENWKQCHECGQVVPIYETKMESELSDFVDPSDNPFDQGKTIIGLDNKNRKKENRFEKLRKEIEKEKDEDIKAELKKGNIVNILYDSTDSTR